MLSRIGTVMSPGRNWGGIWILDPHEPSSLPFGCQSHKRRPSSPRAPLCEGARRGPQQQATLGILEQIASHQSPATICSALPTPNTRRPPPSTNHTVANPPARPPKKTSHQLCVSTPPSRLRRRRILLRSLSAALRLSLPPTSTPLSTTASLPRLRSTSNQLVAARRRSRETSVLQETQSAGRFSGPISNSNQALPPTFSRVQEHVPLGLIPAPRWVISTSASTLLVAGNNRIHRRACASVTSIPTSNCRAKFAGRAIWFL